MDILEILSDRLPLMVLGGLLWRRTTGVDKRLDRIEDTAGELRIEVRRMDRRLGRLVGRVSASFRPADVLALSAGD